MSLAQSFYQRKKISGWENDEPITLSSLLILEAADKYGISWKVLPGTKIIEMEYKGQKKYFRYQISSATTDVGFSACLDKTVTNNLLENAGIRVPKGFGLMRSDDRKYWDEVFDALQKPVVVKPSHGNQGNAISMGILDKEQYQKAVEKAFAFLNDREAGVVVEETFVGNEYRVLATREKVLGVIFRVPANVVGDGTSTLQQLIDQKNSDPRRGSDDTYALFKIQTDENLMSCLAEQNLTLDFVPTKDQQVFLRRISNIAKGGDSIDMTDQIHPSVAEIAVKAVNALPGLDFVGVDFMTKDITQPQTENSYIIVEVNSSPGFCIHEFPYLGKKRHAEEEFLAIMFPELHQT
jgi:glutamate--cysteine ligase